MQQQETWNIQDSTKLQEYMDCPRQYFFEYVLGWRNAEPSIHLEYGIAFHKLMECIYPVGGPDFSDNAIARGYTAFLEYYRSIFSEDLDDAHSPKNPECTFRALLMYRDLYKSIDTFDVLHNEVAGSVLLGKDNRKLYFKLDTICRSRDGNIFGLDHKTSGSSFRSIWALEFAQSIQMGTYSHVLYCMYPSEEVYGMKINGIFIHKEPELKKDGTPKANSKDTEFHRIPVAKTLRHMQDWLVTVEYWLENLERDFDKLSYTTDSNDILETFPKNPRACTKYFGCVYAPFCAAYLNPLQNPTPPVGFKEEHWDPRGEYRGVKKVVEL